VTGPNVTGPTGARIDAGPLLEVQQLHHRFAFGPNSIAAIEDVTFDVARGEFLAIVGPSGSGKTTLLRCLSGLMRPTSGLIRLNGHPVTDVPEELAVVFQDYSRSLFPWLTVRANVDMPLRRLGLDRAERDARIATSLEEVGLREVGGLYPWQLSGGMQQRVAIARAFAFKPALLLMDEPFASVDAQTRADLQDMLLEVWKRHDSTVLFVTHDIDESVYLADRVLVLSRPPARVTADITVDLARPRDQIATKEMRRFAEIRADVARLIKRPAAAEAAAGADREPPVESGGGVPEVTGWRG
jgi:NitT/TauT family transport system ATP-binding protein